MCQLPRSSSCTVKSSREYGASDVEPSAPLEKPVKNVCATSTTRPCTPENDLPIIESPVAAKRIVSFSKSDRSPADDGSDIAHSIDRPTPIKRSCSTPFSNKLKHEYDVPDLPLPIPVKRAVSFDKIKIREYERSIADHPFVADGPPIGIGWNYECEVQVPVDQYEETRSPVRRNKKDLLISSHERRQLLKENGHSLKEIRLATRAASEKRRELMSTKNGLKYAKVEEAIESLKRKTVRVLLRKTTEREQKKLWMNAEKWQKKKENRSAL